MQKLGPSGREAAPPSKNRKGAEPQVVRPSSQRYSSQNQATPRRGHRGKLGRSANWPLRAFYSERLIAQEKQQNKTKDSSQPGPGLQVVGPQGQPIPRGWGQPGMGPGLRCSHPVCGLRLASCSCRLDVCPAPPRRRCRRTPATPQPWAPAGRATAVIPSASACMRSAGLQWP